MEGVGGVGFRVKIVGGGVCTFLKVECHFLRNVLSLGGLKRYRFTGGTV